MIELIDVNRSFDDLNVIKKVSIVINDGDFLSITGKSGSGKSTLLNIIGLLDKSSSGKYILNGIDISLLSDDEKALLRREKFGFIFQEYHIDLGLSVYQNLELIFIIKRIKKKDYNQKIIDVLKKLNMEEKIHVKAKKLSGGEKQRVAIARAIINEPDVIIADEPTGALDSYNSTVVLEYLKKLNDEGKTIILVTHNEEETVFSNRIITLKDGVIIDEKS